MSRSSECPHRCGYSYPIPACVRLHLIQHHDYGYGEAQAAYPDTEQPDRDCELSRTGFEACGATCEWTPVVNRPSPRCVTKQSKPAVLAPSALVPSAPSRESGETS